MIKERSVNGFQYSLEASEQDTDLNVCLVQKMLIEYGFKIPELELDEEGQPIVEKFFEALNKIIKKRNKEVEGPDWELKYYSTISNFSFRNISIWWDTNFFNQKEANCWEVNPLEEKELLKDFISGIPSSDIEPLVSMDIRQDRDEINQNSKTVPKLIADAEKISKKLSKIEIKIDAKVGEGDKLFGSVTNIDIEKYLNSNGFEIDKKYIKIIGGSVKSLGKYKAIVRLHRELSSEIEFEVLKSKA